MLIIMAHLWNIQKGNEYLSKWQINTDGDNVNISMPLNIV